MMIFLVDLPELSKVMTVEDLASRRRQRFLIDISAIYSLSCSVILLILCNLFVGLEPIEILFHFYYSVGGNE